jgi:CubicO group peptidase (beta-lactamase class C family)
MKKVLFTLLMLAVAIACKTEKQERTALIDAPVLEAYFKDNNLPAAVMGYTTRDGEVGFYALGPAVWGKEDRIDENHIFRIFSMTKAIASVAALQLVEQGLLGLDDPLNELMPTMVSIPILTEEGELYQSEAPITLRHLLTHTSGFGYDFTSARLATFNPETWAYEDKPRLFEPGARWHYGTSTDWVGKIIEKVSGKDLETYLRENITGPLGMQSTWFNVPDSLQEKIVSWGTRDSTGFSEYQRIPVQPETTYSAGGGLFSSPKDYLTFLRCILNEGKYEEGQLLKPETVVMLFTDQLLPGLKLNFDIPEQGLPPSEGRFPDETDTFSLAWALEDSADETVRSPGAAYWAGIANSYYTVDKDKGVAVAYFTQFLPFNDKQSYDFYRLFEQQVLSAVPVP